MESGSCPISECGTPPEVIVMTAYANPDTVDAALKEGAWLYIEKPFDLTYVITAASQALKYHRQKQQCPIPSSGHIQLVGNSGRMKLLKQKVALAAGSDVPILIVGETGTGKELVSQVIHSTGIRSQNPFVTLDCTVLQETLVESELFGHKKGSFTSATTDYDGLILQARGGTLFIDEIGELNLSLQKKFLRVLQNRSYRPVGANRDIESDFRMIAATNRNLDSMVRSGMFRQDLLFRMKAFVLEVPPLRERKEDILDLIEHYIPEFSRRYQIPLKKCSSDFMDTMLLYDWPGNVRELINALDCAFTMARKEPVLFACHLPMDMRVHLIQQSIRTRSPDDETPTAPMNSLPPLQQLREQAVADVEKKYFEKLIMISGGNMKQMIEISGLGQAQIYRMMNKYNIRRR